MKGQKWNGPYTTSISFPTKDEIEYSYPWKDEPIKEKLVDVEKFVLDCKNAGWKLTWQHPVKVPNELYNWKTLIENSIWLHFEK